MVLSPMVTSTRFDWEVAPSKLTLWRTKAPPEVFQTAVRRVSNAALANAAVVLSSTNRIKHSMWGQRRKINPKSLGPAFSFCCLAGIDAALVRAQFSFRRRTPHQK